MWEGIEDGQAWLVQGMKLDSLLWVTDGSYNRKRAPVLSRVGWIIFCQDTGKRLVGSSWEKSSSASSYRAELLGLCLLHLLAQALSEFYKVSVRAALENFPARLRKKVLVPRTLKK